MSIDIHNPFESISKYFADCSEYTMLSYLKQKGILKKSAQLNSIGYISSENDYAITTNSMLSEGHEPSIVLSAIVKKYINADVPEGILRLSLELDYGFVDTQIMLYRSGLMIDYGPEKLSKNGIYCLEPKFNTRYLEDVCISHTENAYDSDELEERLSSSQINAISRLRLGDMNGFERHLSDFIYLLSDIGGFGELDGYLYACSVVNPSVISKRELLRIAKRADYGKESLIEDKHNILPPGRAQRFITTYFSNIHRVPTVIDSGKDAI